MAEIFDRTQTTTTRRGDATVPEMDLDVISAAQRVVADNSSSVESATTLLKMLGIHPDSWPELVETSPEDDIEYED